MKIRASYKLFFCLCLMFSVTGFSQAGSNTDFIKAKFDQHRSSILQEKIYAHTDKEFYLSGEILWFSLFYVDASLHRPLDISKIAYVELLNKDHQSVLQAKISLSDGNGNGTFMLPGELPSGRYYFRAYTNSMKNFDPDFVFEKQLTVVNTLFAEPAVVQKTNADQYDIQFFPEGGQSVTDIPSKLAFHAVDASGKGISFTGVIVTKKGDTVSHFQPLKFGIGNFLFSAKKGEEYEAIIQPREGTSFRKRLPVVASEGYVIQVEKGPDQKLRVQVKSSPAHEGKTIYLFVHSRQQIEDSKSGAIKSGVAEFLLDDEKLLNGISHITVFNEDKKPVCERLIFKKPQQQLKLDATTSQQQFDSRKKVDIEVFTKQEEGKAQPARFSVAVYQADSVDTTSEDILSYLYLSSDLKGFIESPGYYFSNNNAETETLLDNLMLTHGWRRFKWDDVLQEKKPVLAFAPEYEGHIITGKLLNKKTNAAANGISVGLSIPDSNFQFYTGKANEVGEVKFFTKKFYGRREIFSQALNRDDSYQVTINSPFWETYSSRSLSASSFTNLSGSLLQAKSVSTQVQNVYSSESLNKLKLVNVPSYSFYKPSGRYLLDDYTRFPTMEEVLREYVREVVVNKQDNKLLLSLIRKDLAGVVAKHNPLVLVDGVALLENYNQMFGYDPLKVKELEVVNSRYFLGNSEFDGLVNFKTYKGYPDGLPLDSNAVVIDYEGLQAQREFYSPSYATETEMSSRKPDFRTLLYWVPNAKTDETGKSKLSFYTSDLPGKYVVVIQALSKDGKAGSAHLSFDVVNPIFARNNQ